MLKPFPDASAPPLIHVGREPVYDRNGLLVAYRLRFRDTADGAETTPARTAALSQLIVAAFTEYGLDELVGPAGCFVTVNRDFLTGAVPVPFAPGRAALLLAEPFVLDDATLAGAATLARRGFSLAVDLRGGEWGPLLEPLFGLVSYVTLAVPEDDAGFRARWARFPGVHLIAAPGTEGDPGRAAALGFELFEGHGPGVVSRPRLSSSATARLRLIAALSREDVDIDDVTAAVEQDPAVSYRLLHAAGAAASGQTTRVISLREAVMLLGLDRIQGWVTLMLLADGAVGAALDKHAASVVLGRARFCRNLAGAFGAPPDSAFTVGLLSGLAEILGTPVAPLVAALPLAEPLVGALVAGEGVLGAVLRTAVRYAGGVVDRLPGVLAPPDLVHAQFNALRWTNHLLAAA
ncbi:EAL and HDOD domain-containing protein [Cryptosporangium arvum]|uniref:EAL and HDOD domain-containing protein n=1 Tax=Cryptosporangium arvum TaxID=80871 RepID=UPI0004B0014F|nr:HDOD domain-containing protein [Cryptosporangium arvum]